MAAAMEMIRVTVRDAGHLLQPRLNSSPIISVILLDMPLTVGELVELPGNRKVEVVEAGEVNREHQWSQTVRVVSL